MSSIFWQKFTYAYIYVIHLQVVKETKQLTVENKIAYLILLLF